MGSFGMKPFQEHFRINTSGPNPWFWAQTQVPGPRTWVWARCDLFWLVWSGFALKVTTSAPNPWFWTQNHRFGPDVVIFSLTPPGASQKPS